MKKSIAYGAVLLVTALFMSGCASAVRTPILGAIYTKTTNPEFVTSNATSNSAKVGTATCESVLGFVSGDCSIEAAMKNGGIKKVHYVDSKIKDILGIYVEYILVVHGE